MEKRGPKPRQQLPIRWTPEFAYAVGLIATDGCLYNDGRHINFTSKDLQLIRTFMKCLNLNNRIGKKKSGFADTWAYNLQFGNVVLHAWLRNIGLTPAKSKTMGAIRVPKEYFSSFLRGLFDGDGSFYSYRDPRWPSSLMYYFQFSSASLKHLIWLQKMTRRYFGCVGHLIHSRPSGTYNLRFAKQESNILAKHIYPNPYVPHLERKRKEVYDTLTCAV